MNKVLALKLILLVRAYEYDVIQEYNHCVYQVFYNRGLSYPMAETGTRNIL